MTPVAYMGDSMPLSQERATGDTVGFGNVNRLILSFIIMFRLRNKRPAIDPSG